YRTQPNAAARQEAANYRAERMTSVDCHDPNAVKAVLAQGLPLVGGFNVTASLRKGGGVPLDTFDPPVTGGNAMAIVGYDDSKRSPKGNRGAFKIMNS